MALLLYDKINFELKVAYVSVLRNINHQFSLKAHGIIIMFEVNLRINLIEEYGLYRKL